MSDHIPFEIQMDIIKRLPTKSLVKFRSVSKPWKSLIDSSEFINNYHVTNAQPDHLLVSYRLRMDSYPKYVSFVDDDNFPQNKFTRNAPLDPKLFISVSILGSSHGLLCLYGTYYNVFGYKQMAILWNPSIQKTVGIVVPANVLDMSYENTFIGFGVCPKTSDPKLVKVTQNNSPSEVNTVEVFTLSSRAWRSISNNLPRKSIVFKSTSDCVVLNGVIYWKASDDKLYHLIVSFDLTREEFGEIYLPYHLQHSNVLSMSKLSDSLVVLKYTWEAGIPVCIVWMMDHGVQKSFTKLFTVNIQNISVYNKSVRGFRKNGKPIFEKSDDRRESSTLEVYDPCSEKIYDLGIRGSFAFFSVSSYTETLLLLDHPGSIIDADDDGHFPWWVYSFTSQC